MDARHLDITEVLYDVEAEIGRQDAKWGVRSGHPDLTPTASLVGRNPAFAYALAHYMPTEARAKRVCEERFASGSGSWADILVEEVAEVIGTCGEPNALRAELIQVAAVAVNWIADLDSRTP